MSDLVIDSRLDRPISLMVRADIADRLDAMCARHGVTLPELTGHLLRNISVLVDVLPFAVKRSVAAERKAPTQ